METNELSNSNLASIVSSALQSFKEFDLDSLKDVKGLSKFLPMPLGQISVNLDEIAESLKNQPFFDYNKVVEVAKNLKSIGSMRQNQIESVLTQREGQLSNNKIQEIINAIGKKQEGNIKLEEEETHSDLSDDGSDAGSVDYSLAKKDGAKLLDSVKENLDLMIQNDGLKKKNSKKRWWTPEEVRK